MIKEKRITETIKELTETVLSEIRTHKLPELDTFPCTTTVYYYGKPYLVAVDEPTDVERQMAESIANQIMALYTSKTTIGMTPIETGELSTYEMRVTEAFIGMNPKSYQYGHIIGFFTYRGQNYEFRFHVHTPGQKLASLSNKMVNVDEVVSSEEYGMVFSECETTTMGCMAFWKDTPKDYLKERDEDSYQLRLLMEQITAFSRKHGLCKEFRKLDKVALKVNPIYAK